MGYDGNTCNMHLNDLARLVKQAVWDNDLVGLIFNTIGVSDGMSNGTDGMRYSLVSRDVIADSIEAVVGCQAYDGVIAIGGCDKNMPGGMIGMLRMNVPGIYVAGELGFTLDQALALEKRQAARFGERTLFAAGDQRWSFADALRIARRLAYRGVGTVEFLVAGDRHWFLEVNPRLQVEHPVTEEVTGIDIVELMLRVAAGLGLPLRQADVRVRGHAVEARLCAEDAERDFLPATGSIEQIAFPGGGVRVESGVRTGSEVTPHYDSLLAKLVVRAATRGEALDRLQAALAETWVLGVTTNADFLRRLLARAEVRDASFHTRSIDEWLARPDRTAQAVPPAIVAAAGLWWMFDERARAPDCGAWSAADVTGWQMHAGDDPLSAVPAVLLRDGATVHEVHLGIPGPDGFTTVQVGDTRLRLALRAQPGGGWQCEQGGEVQPLALARRGTSLFVQAGGTGHLLEVLPYLARAAAGSAGSGELRTPMMGTILATHAEVGQALRAGDVVVTMESMKMEMKICAEHDGVLASLSAVAGQTVERGRVVAVVAAADAPDAAPADAAT